MDLFVVAIWGMIGLLFYYAVKPIYENFQLSTPDVGLGWLIGNFEMIFLTFQQFRLGGKEIAALSPFTCPDDHPDLQDGLCYQKCREGYRGVGPVCWANSENIGIGTPIGLEECPEGWNNDGLTCREPLRWNGCKHKGLFGECYGGAEGGAVRGRLDGGGKCPGPGGDEYVDKVDGLCYKKCPEKLPNHIPGMPYLCYAGGDLSYGRGVGKIPALIRFFGKYTFP